MTLGVHGPALEPAAQPPRISVIIPSYNSGTFMREALTSVLAQDPPPHEVIVQDGGSTDATLEILHSFGDRVSWVSKSDSGQSDALNKALARAKGDIILWLNADDLLLPGAIAAASDAFADDPSLVFVYGNFDVVDGAGTLMRRYRSPEYDWHRVFRRGCYIFSGSLFVRHQHLTSIGGFDASLLTCMDLDLLLRLGPGTRSRHIGHTVGQFRLHGAGKSSTSRRRFILEAFRVRLHHAHRSKTLLLVTMAATLRHVLTSSLAPLRYHRYWPRHGRSKAL